MSDIEDILDEVDAKLSVGQQADPEHKLVSLIETIGEDELEVWKHDLRKLLPKFMRRRQQRLTQLLEDRLAGELQGSNSELTRDRVRDTNFISGAITNLRNELQELAEAHIFQWSTYYRSCVNRFFEAVLSSGVDVTTSDLDTIRDSFLEHAKTIFQKGYDFRRENQPTSHRFLVNKTLSGLERFVELPLEAYVSRVQNLELQRAEQAKDLCSSMITGILLGYSKSKFSNEYGAQILPRIPPAWANALGFLTSRDAANFVRSMEPGRFQSGVEAHLIPFLHALDNISRHITDYFPAILLAELNWSNRRLEVTLEEPPDASEPRRIDIHIALDEVSISSGELDEADRVGIAILVAALRADVEQYALTTVRQTTHVINAAVDDRQQLVRRIEQALDEVIHARRSQRGLNAPLTYNFAREFPLRDPQRRRFYHVPRTSVRDLLKIFERHNGIRLWCSARRSGKTTACFDLTSTETRTSVVSQTCDSTDPHINANHFFDSVIDALENGGQIKKDFVIAAVAECVSKEAERYVLVIDEYETLFHRLRVAIRRDPDVRFTVVQPLLNQLVSFSQENLLVFLGQQPNAHYIMMDQNQLSAYVQQDPFPLFRHEYGTTVGEFSELIRKVFTTRITFDGGFADGVFEETAGHPFLTVNVLVELVEWLINERRPRRNLRLYREDFDRFREQMLTSKRIQLSTEYDFFREAISEAISELGRASNMWLYGGYSLIRRLASEGVSVWQPMDRVRSIVEGFELHQEGLSAEHLVRTLASANFLEVSEKGVRPRIRVLARVAYTVSPRRG